MSIAFSYWQPVYGAENSFIYLLTAVLFLLAVISFIRNKLDILAPSFIYSICLTGCCGLAALYTQKWNLPMHFNTAMIMIGMSSLFLMGAEIAGYVFNTDLDGAKNIYKARPLYIGWPLWAAFFLVICYCLYLNYQDFIQAAGQLTDKDVGFNNMLRLVNNGLNHKVIQLSRWNAYRMRFAMGMGYISVLAVWVNGFTREYKEMLKWSCFVLLYLPFMILTGGRQQFLYLVLFSLISFFFVYRKNGELKNNIRRELTIIGISLLLFLISFLGIGIANGKIGADANFLNVLVHYAGTNISAFDVYINEMIQPDTQYIGTTTLDPIYGFLHNHGVNVPEFFQYLTLFTVFKPVTTNVYTAFYRYIKDFGYLGCGMVMFLLGFFYTAFYKKVYSSGLQNWMILLYASIAYPIFLMGREERFFNEIFSTSKLSFCVGILILYKFFAYFSEKRSCKL